MFDITKGEYLAVEKIPKEAHEYKSPTLEAIEKIGNKTK